METFVQDVAYGIRVLRKSPGITALIVGTLALGIGANSAVFSIVQAVLLRPLPYHDPSRLTLTFDAPVHNHDVKFFLPYRHFQEWSKASRSYSAMAALTWASGPRFLLGRGSPQSITGIPVTTGFFSVLGVPAQFGRTFTRDDLSQGCSVVLSHSFWQNRLGAESNIVGRRLTLDDKSCTVLGVMPPGFVFFPAASNLWTLITPDSELGRNPDRAGVAVIGRLNAGASVSSAEAELRALNRDLDQGRSFGTNAEPVNFDLQQEFTWLAGHNLRSSVLLLLGAVGVVLLIACVNVANLLLGRSLARQREMAIRVALGGGRWRLIRQLLTESLLLGVSAAVLGACLAAAIVHYFRAANPVTLPPGATPAVNLPVLGFTVIVALATAIFFGFAPAWQSANAEVGEALKSGRRSSAGFTRQRLAKALIVAESTLSLVLLAAAGLLIKSILNFASAPLGFPIDRLITMTMTLPPLAFPDAQQQTAFFERLKSQLQRSPDIEGVGITTNMALKSASNVGLPLIEGERVQDPKAAIPDTAQQAISDGYFRFLGIPVEQGREIQWSDQAQAPRVAVVNSALVRKYLPAGNPIGRRILFEGQDDAWMTIVGVVGNEKQASPFEEMSWTEPPIVYHSLAQQPRPTVDLVVRISPHQGASAVSIQQAVWKLAPDIRISDVKTMQEVLDRFTAYPQFRAVVMGVFAAFALLLSVIGMYGVLAQLVVQRTQEIGIRMALGAQARDILLMFVKHGMMLTAIGVALGLVLALSSMRLLQHLLYGVGPDDPLIIVSVSTVLILPALGASFIPARRAARVNPIESLRAE